MTKLDYNTPQQLENLLDRIQTALGNTAAGEQGYNEPAVKPPGLSYQ